MFISVDMCMDVKCFIWSKSSFKLPKVRTTGPGCLFSSRQMCSVFGQANQEMRQGLLIGQWKRN